MDICWLHTAVGSDSLSYGVRSQAFFDVVSIALKLAPARDNSFSGLESLTIIALSCNPKLSPAGHQTARHDGFYPFNTLRLVNCASLCWALSAARRPLSRWFLRLSLSFFRFHKWVLHTTSFWLLNVTSLAMSFDMYNVEILHHAQIGQNAYTEYARTIYIPENKAVGMACQKVCKQGRDDAWKQRSTYWQSSIPQWRI